MFVKRYDILILIGILALLLVACSPASEPTGAESELELTRLNGEETDLADYRGQVLVVNFWATWCGPCRVEMPELQAYYDAHKDNPDFAFLAINRGEAPDTAQTYIEDGNYTFPVVLDQEEKAVDYFGGVRGMPTTFVLDENGEIVFEHAGPLNRELLEEQVTPLITDS